MALAAMAALQERHIEVPSDVAVIGFDDLEAARFGAPPLTTVRQPLYQQGATALDLILAQIEGRPFAAETVTADGARDPSLVRMPLGRGAAGTFRAGHADLQGDRSPAARAW